MSLYELLIVLLVALLVFKPEHMPELANKFGRMMRFLSSIRDGKFFSSFNLTTDSEKNPTDALSDKKTVKDENDALSH
jgi:Sec-independent protein translocase protein TatA